MLVTFMAQWKVLVKANVSRQGGGRMNMSMEHCKHLQKKKGKFRTKHQALQQGNLTVVYF